MDLNPQSARPPEAARETEIELKFAVDPGDLPRLQRHKLLADGAPKRRMIETVYFDTPDLSVHRAALALRVRKEGRRYTQTLKTDNGSAPIVTRGEWQQGVSGIAPDLSQPEMREKLDGVNGAELQPVFITRIRRNVRVIHPKADTTVEICFDRGNIEAPDGVALPVCELELELKQGDPTALFDIARKLNETVPLRIETRSKAARGYALVAGAEDNPLATRRYGRIELAPDQTGDDAFAQIIGRCIWHMIANDRAALAGEAEGVHQMRVALRRLRATLSLFKPFLPEEQWRHVNEETKRAAAVLGQARNWDVFAEAVANINRAFPTDADLRALRHAIAEKQSAAYGVIRDNVASGRYTEFALGLVEWVETRAWRQDAQENPLATPIDALADQLLEKRFRKMRKLAKRFDDLDAAERHQLRIALKKLRYAADSFERLYDPKPTAQYLKRLSNLQEELGLLNDIATAETLLDDLMKASDSEESHRRGAALVKGWCGHTASAHEPKLRKKVARLRKAKPFWHRPREG